MSNLKLPLGTLLDSRIALQELGNHPLPAKVSYWIGRVSSKVTSEFEAFEKTRVDAVKRLGKPCAHTQCPICKQTIASHPNTTSNHCGQELKSGDAAPDGYWVPTEDKKSWDLLINEIDELKAVNVEVPISNLIKLSELGSVQIRPNVFVHLGWLFESD